MNNLPIVVLCSRLKSTRLPEKALLPLAGKPILWHCLHRLSKIGVPVVLAIPPDDISSFSAIRKEFPDVIMYHGEPASPLHRTAKALGMFPDATHVIRATHDDPLLDPGEAKVLLSVALRDNAGYAVTSGLVDGGGVEVISRDNLEHAARTQQGNVEFISYYVRGGDVPNKKRIKINAKPEVSGRPYRLTVDFREDWWLLDAVLTELGPEATLAQVCSYLDRNPDMARSNQLPEVTFYTCVRNGVRFLDETIRSVLHSTRANSEYIIVDDGSTDGSTGIVCSWLGRLGTEAGLRFVRNTKNEGLANRSNEAVAIAKGRYVMRIDADDILRPGAIDGMLEVAKAKDADIVYGHFQEVGEDGYTALKGPDINQVRHPGCALMRRSFLDEVRFRDGIRLGDGKELWSRVKGTAKVAEYPHMAWFYRRHPGSITYKSRLQLR